MPINFLLLCIPSLFVESRLPGNRCNLTVYHGLAAKGGSQGIQNRMQNVSRDAMKLLAWAGISYKAFQECWALCIEGNYRIRY